MKAPMIALALLALGAAPVAAQSPYQGGSTKIDPTKVGPVDKSKILKLCDATPYIKCNAVHEQMNCHAVYDVYAKKCRPRCQKTGKTC